MIDTYSIYVIIVLYGVCVGAMLFGLLKSDITSIKMEREAKKHPYAKWRRNRPHITIYIIGTNELRLIESIASVKQNKYKNKTIIVKDALPVVTEQLALYISEGTIIDSDAIVHSITRLNYLAHKTIEIGPAYHPLHGMSSLLKNYRLMATNTSLKARNGLAVSMQRSNVILRASMSVRAKDTVYLILSLIIRFITTALMLYSSYLAIILNQPQVLLMIIVAFTSYMIVIVSSDETIRLKTKALYLMLLPASFTYFYTLGVTSFWRAIYENTRRSHVKTSHEYASS